MADPVPSCRLKTAPAHCAPPEMSLAKPDQTMPPGIYQFRATGTVDGENNAFATATVARVDSVLVGSGSQGLTVNLAGIGSVPFNEVQEII